MHTAEDRTMVIYRARGDTLNPEHTELYTYKTWWFLAGPEAESAKCYKQITEINIPLLLIQGRRDQDLRPEEAEDLASLAAHAGTATQARYTSTPRTISRDARRLWARQ